MTKKDTRRKITVGRLMEELKIFDPDAEIHFGGLHFYRLKSRGDLIVQCEFDETVYRDSAGRLVVEDHERDD